MEIGQTKLNQQDVIAKGGMRFRQMPFKKLPHVNFKGIDTRKLKQNALNVSHTGTQIAAIVIPFVFAIMGLTLLLLYLIRRNRQRAHKKQILDSNPSHREFIAMGQPVQPYSNSYNASSNTTHRVSVVGYVQTPNQPFVPYKFNQPEASAPSKI